MVYSLPSAVAADTLLRDLLTVSLTGVNLLRPLYGPAGEVEDFALEYLNPAAQRITGLPEQPGGTARTHFPDLVANDVLAFYRRVFDTGEADHYNFNYQSDGFDNYFHVAARRSGELLVVSFTKTADQDRSPVEVVVRESQTREQQARQQVEQFNHQLEARLQERTQQLEAVQNGLLATAERRAQQREELYQMFEQLPASLILLRGPEHRIDYYNPAYERLFPGRQLRGRTIAESQPESTAQGFVALLDQVYQTGQSHAGNEVTYTYATEGPTPGATIYLNFTYEPYREDGLIVGVAVFAFDVTEQVLARQEREAQRRQLEQLFMQVPAPIVILDGPELVYQLVNPSYQQIFPGRKLQGKPLLLALPELVDTPIPAIIQQVYHTGETFRAQELPLRLARQVGGPLEEMYWNFTYQARRKAHDEIDGVLVFAYDVTEQVQARAETERQRRRLSEVFEQAPVAICVFAGPDYVLEVVNPPMGEMLGHPADQLVGQPFFEALPELADQGVRELLDQVRQTGTPYLAQEQEIHLARHGLGSNGYYNFTYQPLRDAQGLVTAVTCIATDVTEQVLARAQVQNLNEELAAINEEMQVTNEELHESNTQLLRTNADLDTFVYAASHDLKAPIANIEGLLDALREYLPSEAQAPLVSRLVYMMQGAINRFQQTVAHLTDVARLQHAPSAAIEEVDVARMLEDVRLDLLPLLESTRAELRVDVSDCPHLYYPAKNLRSILLNLLSNAVKYRAPDRAPVVQVRTKRTAGQGVVLEVQDNGLGLDERQQGQLFTMFRRLHTHVEGSGVGLYLIKRLIENAGGTITVYSQLGVGSTFTVTLPRAYRSS